MNNKSLTIQHHLVIAILLGVLFRLLSIHYVWGPQALDDYLDNLIPAWKHFSGLDPDLHNYRSPFYLWILSYWMKFGSLFGVENPVTQIQWVYFLQGSISLLAVWAVYFLSQKNENKLIPILSMYLVSLHGLLPFATTRSFMESFVLGPITLGLIFLYKADQGRNQTHLVWTGLFLLGVSSLIRFQSGIIYVAWVGLMFFTKNKKQWIVGVILGFCLILAEALIDLGYGRSAFQTLQDYFVFNSNQDKSGRMPWYNTFFTLAGMIYFPISALIGKSWVSVSKKHWKLLFPIFVYFLAHTINPHKEERYLYPILGIVFFIWGSAWAENWDSKIVKWIFSPLFLILNTLVLFIGCFVNTQVGLVGPLADLQSRSSKLLVLDHDLINMRPNMAEFFIRQPSLYMLKEQKPEASLALSEFDQHSALESLALLSTKEEHRADFLKTHEKLSKKLNCTEVLMATSLSDQVLYQLRPERNERRRPTEYFFCKRTKL